MRVLTDTRRCWHAIVRACATSLCKKERVHGNHRRGRGRGRAKRQRVGSEDEASSHASTAVDVDVMVYHMWVRAHPLATSRRVGTASRLLRAVRQLAEEHAQGGGDVQVTADVLQSNTPALQFWRKALGAERVEEPNHGGTVYTRMSGLL